MAIGGAVVAVDRGGVAWVHALRTRRRTIGILENAIEERLPDHSLNGSKRRLADRVAWETKTPISRPHTHTLPVSSVLLTRIAPMAAATPAARKRAPIDKIATIPIAENTVAETRRAARA